MISISRPVGTVIPISWPAIAVRWPAIIATPATAVPAMSVIASAIVTIAVIPGPSPNENTAHEVGWPVIAIGCASIGVVTIIPIRADRSRANPNTHRTDTDANGNLGMSLSGNCEKQNGEQRHIF
jgi:hypothetical protein